MLSLGDKDWGPGKTVGKDNGKGTRSELASLPASWGWSLWLEKKAWNNEISLRGDLLRFWVWAGLLFIPAGSKWHSAGRGPLLPHLHGPGQDVDLCRGPGHSRVRLRVRGLWEAGGEGQLFYWNCHWVWLLGSCWDINLGLTDIRGV